MNDSNAPVSKKTLSTFLADGLLKHHTRYELTGGYIAMVSPGSGQVKPFDAMVFTPDGEYIGFTGFCKSPYAACNAARNVIKKFNAKKA
jgi:hypothetical protein